MNLWHACSFKPDWLDRKLLKESLNRKSIYAVIPGEARGLFTVNLPHTILRTGLSTLDWPLQPGLFFGASPFLDLFRSGDGSFNIGCFVEINQPGYFVALCEAFNRFKFVYIDLWFEVVLRQRTESVIGWS